MANERSLWYTVMWTLVVHAARRLCGQGKRGRGSDVAAQPLTTEQIAERCGVTRKTARRWLHSGELAGVKLSDRSGWRTTRRAVSEFIAQRTSAGRSAQTA